MIEQRDGRNIDDVLLALERSTFRSRFRLGPKEHAYCIEKGSDVIRSHAKEFIIKRLAPALPPKDGKQTPFRGHPVFVAQHATGTCCRSCLEKWHHIQKGRALSDHEVEYVIEVIVAWIQRPEYQVDSAASHQCSTAIR